MKSASTAVLLAVALLVTLPASAEPTTASDARADALFKEGTRLLEEGKFAPACEKLAESRSLSAGLGVTLYLADCYENLGKRREALDLFRAAASLAHARKDKREQLALERVAKLAALQQALVITVTNPDGITVAVDGSALATEAWKEPVFVEPGKHVVGARAPSRTPFETHVEVPVTPGARVGVTIPVLDPESKKWPSRWQLAGLGVAGAGVVAIGIGSAFGLVASSKLGDSNANGHCVANRCDPTGLSLRSDGLDAARVANVGFIVGAVAIVAGVVVYLFAPR